MHAHGRTPAPVPQADPALQRGLRLAFWATLLALLSTFAGLVLLVSLPAREQLRAEILQSDAEVLARVVRSQLNAAGQGLPGFNAEEAAVHRALETSTLAGILAVAVYGPGGALVEALPATLIAGRLPEADRARLDAGEVLVRYEPALMLDTLFLDVLAEADGAGVPLPLLEVLVPLRSGAADGAGHTVHYWIDGSSAQASLQALDRQLWLQGLGTLAGGGLLLSGVLTVAFAYLGRLQQRLHARNQALTRAYEELTLAAKTSAVGAVTAHLMHGLKNPLAGLHRALRRIPDGEAAFEAAERMRALVEETTTLLRQERRGAAVAVPVSELLALAATKVRPAAAERGLTIEHQAPPGGALPLTQANLVLLILNNLLENALVIAPAGSSIALSARQTPSTPPQWALRVRDCGPGVAAAVQVHLFSPGWSARADGGGSGLGLAISQQLARHLGGELRLEATGPEGSTFLLQLPADGTPKTAQAGAL